MDCPSALAGFLLLLFLKHNIGVEFELICPQRPITAMAGDDVILSCHLEPEVSVSSDTVVWIKPGLLPKYIHVYKSGLPVHWHQNKQYKNRTALFVDQMTTGNVSLKLSSVSISDSGRYFCFLQSMQKEGSVQLSVGVVSTPTIRLVSASSSGVVLQCASAGWYPRPEVSWLDGEGNLLSAGPAGTSRGPDGLYTVRSKVALVRRHNSSFTCRVQQKDIGQTREAHIHVPDSSFAFFDIFWCTVILILAFPCVLCLIQYWFNRSDEQQTDVAPQHTQSSAM